jgi:glycosyltransferase involved in cell wall biosynthesis
MSCGVPVIALETPESQEFIADGISGILIPADGDYQFYRRTAAKKLLFLLENEDLRQSMKIAAEDRVARHYDFESAMRRRIEVYRELGKR